MRYPLLLADFLRTPWAMLPDRLATVATVLVRASLNQSAPQSVLDMVAADVEAREARRQQAAQASSGGIAVLPFYGIVTQRPVSDVSGPGTISTQAFGAALRQAVADESVSGIVVDIDSPGGSVFGVAELADQMRAARAAKPVYAVANSMAASAAYWVGSQASQTFITPGGQAGSIGVYAAHEDFSRALESAGIKVSLISAGKYKVEGNPYEALGSEARADMQSSVDEYYGMFTRDVAKGRGVPVDQVRDGMGEGRVLGASAAKAAAMVDGVATLEQVIGKMQRDLAATKASSARVALARRELDIIGG